MPKSESLAKLPSSPRLRTLAGLTSRCTISASWARASPAQICRVWRSRCPGQPPGALQVALQAASGDQLHGHEKGVPRSPRAPRRSWTATRWGCSPRLRACEASSSSLMASWNTLAALRQVTYPLVKASGPPRGKGPRRPPARRRRRGRRLRSPARGRGDSGPRAECRPRARGQSAAWLASRARLSLPSRALKVKRLSPRSLPRRRRWRRAGDG